VDIFDYALCQPDPPVIQTTVSPQFRQSTSDNCVFEASYDDGQNWVGIFDYSLCQPDPPIIQTTVSPQFRQNPSDNCVLQASYDEGATWVDIFDYSLCQSENIEQTFIDNSTVINNSTEYIQNITNNYDGTPESIAPDMDYDGSADDLFRDDVTCLASEMLIEAICISVIEMIQKQEQQSDNILNIVGMAIGLVAVLAGALALAIGSGGLAIPFVLSVVGSLFPYVATLTSADISAFQNEDAKEEVKCCFYNNIRGGDVTQAAFQGGLSNCDFSGDAEKIGNALAQALSEQDVYLMFLQFMQEVYVPANVAGVPGCFCDCQETAFTRLQDDEPGVTVETINQTQFFPTQDSNVSTILSNSVTFNLGGTFRITRFQIKHFVGQNPEQYWQEWEVIIGTETLVMKHVDLDESFELPFVETLRPQAGITQITINKTVGGNNFSWDWIRFDYCTE